MLGRNNSSAIKYRPDIDGLRAIAVLSVVLYHAFPYQIPGGYIGVDIFFVISGFLITSIILGKLNENKFSFTEFYIHRVNRIFPALILVLSFTYVAGWNLLLPVDLNQLGNHVLSATTFTSNLTFWKENGYFDVSSEHKPLLHLWSLAIEEQFYIFWPFVLWILAFKKFNLYWIVIVLASISFVLNVITIDNDTSLAFFSLQTRFWELLVGAFIAILSVMPINFKYKFIQSRIDCSFSNFRFHNLIASIGFALIVTCLFLLSKELLFPGYWAILPTFGAALIILANKSWLNNAVLSNKTLVSIGLISYPFYLWHWPLLSFAMIQEAGSLTVSLRIIIILISAILATLTFYFIERPIRSRTKNIINYKVLVILLISIGIIGYVTKKFEGFETRYFAVNNEKFLEAIVDWAYPGNLETLNFEGHLLKTNHLNESDTIKREVVFFGDSHIEQLGPKIDSLTKLSDTRVSFITGGGCVPIPDVMEDKHVHCKNLLEDFSQYLNSTKVPQVIVIGACWNCYFIDHANPDLHDEYAYYYLRNNSKHYFSDIDGVSYAKQRLGIFLRELSIKHKVYLLLDNPSDTRFDPKYILRKYNNASFKSSFKVSQNQIDLNEQLKNIGHQASVDIIDQLSNVCPNGLCNSVNDLNIPIYKDTNHMRPFYVIQNSKYIDDILLN